MPVNEPPVNGPPEIGHEPVVDAALRLLPSPGPADADPDAPLVARAQAGDRRAFAELFARHHGRVRAMCARLLGGAAGPDVDDAVQTAFLEAWRCLDRFEGRSRFSTWITRVAIHTCFSLRRKLRRLLAVADVSSFSGEAGERAAQPVWQEGTRGADEVASDKRHVSALDEVLARIAPKKRTVFVLADLEGMTSTEIAAVLDVPDATVRTRLFHARKEIAAAMRRHPGFAHLFAGGAR
jgi:RNA polymerase sigma-70 factor (ECF subfamily)